MTCLKPGLLFALFATLLMSKPLFAQETEKLSLSAQKDMITELSRLIKKEYVLEDIGLQMSDRLDAMIGNGFLKEGVESKDFINTINQELRDVYLDKHLGVLSKEKFEELKKMFGLDEEDTKQNAPESHDKPSKGHQSPEAGNHHQGPESHSPSQEKQMNVLAGSRVINRDGRTDIGFLKIGRFDGSEAGINKMKKLFNSFIGVDAIIIDLRACRGGDADMVKALSGYFFDKPQYLVSTIGRADENGKRITKERWSVKNELSSSFSETPVYVMTSRATFSAAESFAFGLQLNQRITIVGENTGGGGHMNTFFALPGGYGVSISVGRTFDGKTGEGFQSTGVIPDIKVEADHAFAKTLELIQAKRTQELDYDAINETIHQRLLSFSEAWYKGDHKSVASMLYNDHKSYIRTTDKNSFKQINLLKAIKKGEGSKTPREYRNRAITIYEVKYNQTATARVMLRDQIHFLHLINDNGTWKIISDLVTKKQMHG